jgi:hypothetical protein
MTSRAVSDAAQKNGGDSLHPICNAVGTTSSVSSRGVFLDGEGKTYVKFHASSFDTTNRQKPS